MTAGFWVIREKLLMAIILYLKLGQGNRRRQRHLPRRHHRAQPVGIIRDQAIEAGGDQPFHVGGPALTARRYRDANSPTTPPLISSSEIRNISA